MRTRIQSLLLTLLLASFAAAEVPSLINYQGRITGPGGAPATGTRNFELKIYDAQDGGNLLYSEDMGAITLGEGGVYGFRFGASGTSVATRSETLATTDGTLTVFNGTLSATAIPGSVSLSDGTFTWSQSAGSSAPANFIGSFVAANGTASAIYIQGAPAAGTPIEVSFNYEEAGITGALSSGSSHWIELTVDGTVQATRERVLAVPFALKAGSVVTPSDPPTRRAKKVYAFYDHPSFHRRPVHGHRTGSALFVIPDRAKRITAVKAYLQVRSDPPIITENAAEMTLVTMDPNILNPNLGNFGLEILHEVSVAANGQPELINSNVDWELEPGRVHMLQFDRFVGFVHLFGTVTIEYEY